MPARRNLMARTKEQAFAVIDKLFATASEEGGASESERDTALRQAYGMMRKHNITETEYGKYRSTSMDSMGEIDVPRSLSNPAKWLPFLYNSIARLFFCRSGYNNFFMTIVGEKDDRETVVRVAGWMHHSIVVECRNKYEDHLIKRGAVDMPPIKWEEWSEQFGAGATAVIDIRVHEIKLKEQMEAAVGDGMAMVLVDKYEAATKYLVAAAPPGSQGTELDFDENSEAFGAGAAHGRGVPLGDDDTKLIKG